MEGFHATPEVTGWQIVNMSFYGTVSIMFITLLAGTAAAQVKYATYENTRFGFSIDYPLTLTMQPAPFNNDGRAFVSKDKDVEMVAWAHYNALFRSVQSEFDEELKSYGDSVTYKRMLKDSFVISGAKDGRIFYQKTLYYKFKLTDVFFIFQIDYPVEQRKLYDAAVERISRSFRFDPNFDV